MKATLLMLSAAGVLLAGGVKAAPQSIEQLYIAAVAAQAEARLANAGVTLPTSTIRVRLTLGGERLNNLHVEPTGDLNADRAVAQALRKMPLSEVPANLAGRDLTLTLGRAPIVQANGS